MSEDSDIVGIPIVNSSIVPESPCIKIVDIVGKLRDDHSDVDSIHAIFPNYVVVPTSDTLYFLFQPILAGKSFIQIWDVHSCRLVCTIDPQYNCHPRDCRVTKDDNSLFVVQESGIAVTIDLWDIHSSICIRKLGMTERLDTYNLDFALSPDDRKLAVSSYTSLHIYDVNTGALLLSSHRLLLGTSVIGWSPNGDWLLTDTQDDGMASFIMWRATDGAVEPITAQITLDCHYYDAYRYIKFSGNTVVCVNKVTSDITIYHLENGLLEVRVRKHHQDCGIPLALSLDTRLFACTTRDGTCVIIRDTISTNIIGGPLRINNGEKIVSLDFASNGKQLLAVCNYTTIQVWDVEVAMAQYRVANSQTEDTSLAPNEGPSTNTPAAPRNTPRARSNSSDSSILNLPVSDVATPSATLSMPTPTPTPYTRRREGRKPIEFDSLLDLPATDTPVPLHEPSTAPKPPPDPQKSGKSADHPVVAPTAVDRSRRRARFTALWARIRRRRKSGPTAEQVPRARKNKMNPESITLRDLSDSPVLPPAPATTNHSEIVEVAAGRFDDRLIIAPPRKKKKRKLPAAPPLSAAENEQVQPASQTRSNASSSSSSSSSSGSSSSQTDSDAESIDWLDYICFCMCCPSNKTKKKRRKEKEGCRS